MKFVFGKNKIVTEEVIVGDSRYIKKLKKIEISLWIVFFLIMLVQSVVWYHTLFWGMLVIGALLTAHIYVKDISLVDIIWKNLKGNIFQREKEVRVYLGTSIGMAIISIGLVIL